MLACADAAHTGVFDNNLRKVTMKSWLSIPHQAFLACFLLRYSLMLFVSATCARAFLLGRDVTTITSPSFRQQVLASQRDTVCYHISSCVQSNFQARGENIALTMTKSSSSTCSTRDISSLQDWAHENGARFHNNIGLVSFTTENESVSDNWGVAVMPSSTSTPISTTLNAGTTILSVPTSLVVSSTRVAEELVNDYKLNMQPAMNILNNSGFTNQVPEFLLFVKILMEMTRGSDSVWHAWLESLPRTFSTGVYMNSFEISCLPPFAFALQEFESRKLDTFRQALTLLLEQPALTESLPFLKDAFSSAQQDELTKWVYSVVFSRCWKYADQVENFVSGISDDVGRSDIVPLGDMFNHADDANVVVNYPDDASNDATVKFVLNQDIDPRDKLQLSLSYGLTTNPYRFLILFGFANDQMKELYCQVLFTKPSKELIELGCTDRSKMVYRTQDGAVSNTVWDIVLYSLLEQQVAGNAQVEAIRKEFYQAHVNGDEETKAPIRERYTLECSLTLRNHVQSTLKEFNDLVNKVDTILEASGDKDRVNEENPCLEMIHKHNKFVQGVFQRVQKRLEGMIQAETVRRRQAMAALSSNKS